MEETNVKARFKALCEQIRGAEARLSEPKTADVSVIEAEISMYKSMKSALARRLGV